ncbi:Uncharacterized protein Rs2_45825 [Raphanus sativus]|nr:Uncharacterized protein Rs2_45825 [Raphanus sativus]
MEFILEKRFKEQQEITEELNLHLDSLCKEERHCSCRYCSHRTIHAGTIHAGTVHPSTVHRGTVHPASIDTVHPISVDTVHPVSVDTVYCGTVHRNTVHRDTVHRGTVHHDTVHPETVHRDTVHRDTIHPDWEEQEFDSRWDNYFGEVIKHEKLEEEVFLVESCMSIGSSCFCRSTPSAEHRSTPLLGSWSTVQIQSHSDFAAQHPHPPIPYHGKTYDVEQHRQNGIDRPPRESIDRQRLTTNLVCLPDPYAHGLNATRNPSQTSVCLKQWRRPDRNMQMHQTKSN